MEAVVALARGVECMQRDERVAQRRDGVGHAGVGAPPCDQVESGLQWDACRGRIDRQRPG